MSEFIQFVVLGLGLAAAYSLLSCGIVLIYRGSGVVNFAHGAFALVGAIVLVELRAAGVPAAVALLVALVVGAALGVLVQNPIMSRLRDAAPITRVIATLGVLIIIQSAAGLHYQDSVVAETQFLPVHAWKVGGVTIESDRVILYAIAVFVVVLLTLFQSKVRLALATRASAENETAVANLGWSPNLLATANWALGGALAALAGAMLVPLSGLVVTSMVLLVVPALAAALLGRFDSFGLALLGATGIGVGQSLIERYVAQSGAADAFPFLVIIAVLVVTGRGLPVRNYVSQRLPSLGDGRIRPVLLAGSAVVAATLIATVFDTNVVDALAVSFSVAIVLMSIVLLTGYAGQLSLAQYAVAGLGAFVAGWYPRTGGRSGPPSWWRCSPPCRSGPSSHCRRCGPAG